MKKLIFVFVTLLTIVSCGSNNPTQYKVILKKASDHKLTFAEAFEILTKKDILDSTRYNGIKYVQDEHVYILHAIEGHDAIGLTSSHDPECEMKDIEKIIRKVLNDSTRKN